MTSNPLCKYKKALGEPKKGIHSYRFLGVAIIDVIFTIIGAFLISYYSGYSFWWVLLILFILGIILHRLFCVNTTINKTIFGEV
jgi:fatty acid desaturase